MHFKRAIKNYSEAILSDDNQNLSPGWLDKRLINLVKRVKGKEMRKIEIERSRKKRKITKLTKFNYVHDK